MRALTDLLLVDGLPLYAPDADMDQSFEDLDSEATGRDQSGVMHRVVLREKVGKWSFVYTQLTDDERKYLLELFKGKPTFNFTYQGDSGPVTTRAYMSNYGISWRDAQRGVWRNLKFDIIEC